ARVQGHFDDEPTNDPALSRTTKAFTRAKASDLDALGLGGMVQSGAATEADDLSEEVEQETFGYVVLGLSTTDLRQRIRRDVAAAVAVAALITVTVLMLLYVRWIGGRLARMARFAQDVAAGDLRHSLRDPLIDEIGSVAAALASMSQRS